MKKITKIISMVLVLAMATLAFCSCGASDEARVTEAFEKMSNAKKQDCVVNMDISISVNGSKTEVPMKMHIQADFSDEENPLYYMLVEMKNGSVTTSAKSFYTGGFLYVDENGIKAKQAVDFEDMMEDSETVDIGDIIDVEKENISDNLDITRNADGTLHVEMLVTEEEFQNDFSDFSKSMAEVVGLEGVYNVSDTLFQFEIDANNNITSMRTIMSMKMQTGGRKYEVTYKMHFEYGTAEDDFKPDIPEDLSDYKNYGILF